MGWFSNLFRGRTGGPEVPGAPQEPDRPLTPAERDEAKQLIDDGFRALGREPLPWPEEQGPPAPPTIPDRGAAIPDSRPAMHGRPDDTRFLRCLAVVLRHEGGFVNDPQDPGGATNMGITRATLAAWRGEAVTPADVQAMTEEEAREIYRARYWNALRCDDLPAGIDLMVFDFGVNAGPGAGARMLQRAVGARADGAVGPLTISAANLADPSAAIDRMAKLREAHYRSLPTFGRFGKGWLRRTDEVRQAAQTMAKT